MINEIAIIEINKQLGLCDTYLLTGGEIDYLNQLGADPTDTCQYYDTTKIVLDRRAQTDTTINTALGALEAYATLDGCIVELAPEVIPDVDIPVFGGSL